MSETVPSSLRDDLIQPFLLETSGIRGRIVRLGPSIDAILGRHNYPPVVAELLGELLTLTSLLSSLLKFEGCFTLQSKSDGPIHMLVSDMTSAGVLRGYAGINQEALQVLLDKTEDPSSLTLSDLTGKGYLAFTVDQGAEMERYQGIVELSGESLSECLQNYFKNSDQIDSGVVVHLGKTDDGQGGANWHAGGLIVQRMPEEGGTSGPLADKDEEELKEDWQRTMILMASCTKEELLDRDLSVHDLLFRLFHEEQVRVFEQASVREGCRCSREKLLGVLKTIPRAELEAHKVEGRVVASCEFCSRSYSFGDEDLAALDEDKEQK